jgi:large subunit ribosomal protein L29
MKMFQINNMTKEELLLQRRNLMVEWFNLRMQCVLKPLDNPKRIGVIRKDIARINTILHEFELGIRKAMTAEKL